MSDSKHESVARLVHGISRLSKTHYELIKEALIHFEHYEAVAIWEKYKPDTQPEISQKFYETFRVFIDTSESLGEFIQKIDQVHQQIHYQYLQTRFTEHED